jgi:hypothetical protein
MGNKTEIPQMHCPIRRDRYGNLRRIRILFLAKMAVCDGFSKVSAHDLGNEDHKARLTMHTDYCERQIRLGKCKGGVRLDEIRSAKA